jgi:hypothetical protein
MGDKSKKDHFWQEDQEMQEEKALVHQTKRHRLDKMLEKKTKESILLQVRLVQFRIKIKVH